MTISTTVVLVEHSSSPYCTYVVVLHCKVPGKVHEVVACIVITSCVERVSKEISWSCCRQYLLLIEKTLRHNLCVK